MVAAIYGGPARVQQSSQSSARPLSAHGRWGGTDGYIDNADKHVPTAIDYLTKSNKGELCQGKGRRGARDKLPPTPATFQPRSYHGRRPPHVCSVRKVARVGRGACAAGAAHLLLCVRCRRSNTSAHDLSAYVLKILLDLTPSGDREQRTFKQIYATRHIVTAP